MELTGKVVLITGGKRIGAVVATHLATRGADLALVYRRSAEEAEATAAAVRAGGRRAHIVQGDLGEADACRHVVDDTARALGRLDVLVNMASLYTPVPLDRLDVATWDRQLAVDSRATFLCSHAALPHLRRQGGGRIVNFTDWVVGERPAAVSPATRTITPPRPGWKALTEALALELAGDQILVNAVAPGPIVRTARHLPPDEHAAVIKATPLGRWGGEIEIAKAVGVPDRERFRDRRDHPCRRRTPREVNTVPTFWDPAARQALVARLDRLTSDATPAWGRFTVAGMAAHLNDAARMALGELPVRQKWMPIRYTPLRQLVIFALPMPKGAPTAPELLARCSGADLDPNAPR